MTIVIWKKMDSSVYYKFVKHQYYRYEVGLKNQYGHEVLYVIPYVYHYIPSLSFKDKCKKRLIRYLQRI